MMMMLMMMTIIIIIISHINALNIEITQKVAIFILTAKTKVADQIYKYLKYII